MTRTTLGQILGATPRRRSPAAMGKGRVTLRCNHARWSLKGIRYILGDTSLLNRCSGRAANLCSSEVPDRPLDRTQVLDRWKGGRGRPTVGAPETFLVKISLCIRHRHYHGPVGGIADIPSRHLWKEEAALAAASAPCISGSVRHGTVLSGSHVAPAWRNPMCSAAGWPGRNPLDAPGPFTSTTSPEHAALALDGIPDGCRGHGEGVVDPRSSRNCRYHQRPPSPLP